MFEASLRAHELMWKQIDEHSLGEVVTQLSNFYECAKHVIPEVPFLYEAAKELQAFKGHADSCNCDTCTTIREMEKLVNVT